MSEKIKLFYSKANTEYLIKRVYLTERAYAPIYYENNVPIWMREWNGVKSYDSYESLVADPTEELIAINQDFLRAHIRQRNHITPCLETVDDYRNHDVQREPEERAIYNGNFRQNNAIPQRQLYGKRNYAPAESGGRSLDQTAKPMLKMQEYYANATRPARVNREYNYER